MKILGFPNVCITNAMIFPFQLLGYLICDNCSTIGTEILRIARTASTCNKFKFSPSKTLLSPIWVGYLGVPFEFKIIPTPPPV